MPDNGIRTMCKSQANPCFPTIFSFIDLFLETYLHRLVGIAALVVITVLPQDADAGEVLPELVGAAHMRASQETEAAGIYLQTLIDGEFHGKISHAFFKTGVYFVRRGKRLG